MAQANPGQSLNAATTAGAGSSVDFMGAAAGSFSTTSGVPFAVPWQLSLIVAVTNWAMNYNQQSAVAYPYVNVGLEVSHDNANWVRVANCAVNGNGVFKVAASFPARYCRANVDSFDSRVTAVTLSAYVAGAA